MAQDRPTLAGFMFKSIVSPQIEKSFLGGQHLRYGKYLQILAYIFESGALLGRARILSWT
jgi:hypothetical protein